MDNLINLLYEILGRTINKRDLIVEFQRKISDYEPSKEEYKIYNLLNDLALDLDYYEPNPEWRKEDPSFYGDDKLEEEIRTALEKIERIRKK